MPISTLRTETDALAHNPPSPAPQSWSRIVLSTLAPSVDAGRWPIRRSVGEPVQVVAGFVTDGHDQIKAELVVTAPDGTQSVHPMPLRYNDEYVASFTPDALGLWTYQARGWLDAFGTWQEQFERRLAGGESNALLASELEEAADLLAGWAKKAKRTELGNKAKRVRNGDRELALSDELRASASAADPRSGMTESHVYQCEADPELARFAAWYEFFPRSSGDPVDGEPPQHTTLDDAATRLDVIAKRGFDIVYLPPIHPIGEQFRKGKDNSPTATEGEPGSPWAIGGRLEDGSLGGHKSVAPELGGMAAFERFIAKADQVGVQVALDIAFQTSPDHPYVAEHPEWFRARTDGTIRYAENPPKKYQDVYPFDFESKEWPLLWRELRSVFEFWIDKGVTVFRVDNPHTKPYAFWEWCLRTLKADHPGLIFLAEAFSRPRVMQTLAKIGFNNSYTYYTWRNTAAEIQDYAVELFDGPMAEYYRPNFWPNTPDIFHEELQQGGRPLHITRYVIAATLSPTYGIYGPPYEHVYTHKGAKEEYLGNEKYEVRAWNWNDPQSLQPLMQRVNAIRKANPALHFGRNVTFLETGNEHLLAYLKHTGDSRVLVVASLDPQHAQEAWIAFDPSTVGLGEHFTARDALGGETYRWSGSHHYVRLDPHVLPAHVFVLGA